MNQQAHGFGGGSRGSLSVGSFENVVGQRARYPGRIASAQTVEKQSVARGDAGIDPRVLSLHAPAFVHDEYDISVAAQAQRSLAQGKPVVVDTGYVGRH